MDDYFSLSLNNILEYLNEGVYFTDLNQNILYCNSGAERITGYRLEEIVTKRYCDILLHTNQNSESLCEEQCLTEKAGKEGKVQETFKFIYHKDGHMVPVTIRTFPVYDKAGQITGFIEMITDNSRQKLGQAKVNALTQAAYVDSLTGLFSKQYLEHRVLTRLSVMPDSGSSFGIVYINIVGFRAINDKYGVTQGDKVLKMAAKTLATAIEAPDLLARWHGASFIIIANTSNVSRLLLLADKLKVLIGETDVAVNDEVISINITVGFTIAQKHDTLDSIIERSTKASLEQQPEEKAAKTQEDCQEYKESADMFDKVKKCFIHPRAGE